MHRLFHTSLKVAQFRSGLALLAGLVLLAGCGNSGPELCRVTGVVMLDGAPLPDAMVTYSPVDERRESYGITDTSGRYELRYNSRTKGAEIGQHEVRICAVGVEPKSQRSKQEGATRIPAHYSGKNFLTIDVKPGSNEVNLELHSDPAKAP